MSLEDEFFQVTLRRCLTIADPATADLQSLDPNGFSILPSQRILKAEFPLDKIRLLLKRVDGLLPPARHLFGVDFIQLISPGKRPIKITIPPETPEPETFESLDSQHELSKIALIYQRCKAALILSSLTVLILDRNLNYIEANTTIEGFGIDATQVIGQSHGEVPELDWLAAQLAPLAFARPGHVITDEFEHAPIPGIVCRYQATAEAYGDEVMLMIECLTPQPWLSRH